jgi:hypothetical protein
MFHAVLLDFRHQLHTLQCLVPGLPEYAPSLCEVTLGRYADSMPLGICVHGILTATD